MSIEKFESLSELDKINVLIVEGKTIGETKDKTHHTIVYKMRDFKAVITFNSSTGKLIKTETFRFYNKGVSSIGYQ